MAKKKKIEKSVVIQTEKSRTFPIKKYGTSYVVNLDKDLRLLLGITTTEVKKGLVGLYTENLRKVRILKQTELTEFTEEK